MVGMLYQVSNVGESVAPWRTLSELPAVFDTYYRSQKITISYDNKTFEAPITGKVKYIKDKDYIEETFTSSSITIYRSTKYLGDVYVKFWTHNIATPHIMVYY